MELTVRLIGQIEILSKEVWVVGSGQTEPTFWRGSMTLEMAR
jgi:hypothetical protein